MACPFKEHETEPGETLNLMGTQMEFSNCWYHFQTIGQEQARGFLYPGIEFLVPLASHIICDKGSLYTIRVIGDCLTNGVVNIFLSLNQKKKSVIYSHNIGRHLLFSFVEINHRMWNKAAMTSTGSSTHTSGTQVSFVGINIVNCSMVLAC